MRQRPRITEAQALECLNAFAIYGSYDAAAQALDIKHGVFARRLHKARRSGLKPILSAKQKAVIEAKYKTPPMPRPAPIYSPSPPACVAQDKIMRVLAIGDTHDDPYLCKDRFRWIGRHAAEMQPDRIVQIGDICDLESLSFHSPNDSESGRYKPRFMADLESLDRALETMLEPISAANVKARIDVTLGNHENRIWRFEETAPETSGMLQRDFADVMKRYKVNFHRYGQFVMIGGVGFVHAPFSTMGKPIGGMTASQTVARQTLHDVVSGHTHKAQAVTSPKVGDDNRVTVLDLGCALPWGHVQNYAKHTTTGWWWGVYEILIKSGRIQGWNAIPMFELERRYR